MALKSIKIINFRNYERLEIKGFSQTNILSGENGSGKTNFLEAISVLLKFCPLRNVSLHELIRWKEESFYIGADVDEYLLEFGFSPQKKVIKLNKKDVPVNELISANPVIAFLPDDINITTGSPDERRFYLDKALSSLDSEYTLYLNRYNRTLKQRNAQLKISPAHAHIWNEELSLSGSRIIEKRLGFIQILNTRLKRVYFDLYQQEIEIRYYNTFRIDKSIKDSFIQSLESSSSAEKERRFTLIGPHRDNFEILILDRSSKSFASQGQKRAIALAMKLSILEESRRLFQKNPIALLDDVLMELDEERRGKILGFIIPEYQSFITATNPEPFKNITDSTSVFEVKNGQLKQIF